MVRKKQKRVNGTFVAIPHPTTGKVFANGTMIEPVHDSTNADRLSLLLWDGGKATTGATITSDGQFYVPAPIDPTILQALTLPKGIASCVSPRNLLAGLSEVMAQFGGFPENSVAAMSRWVMSGWIPELQANPALSLFGPDTRAGRQQFQLLHCLCRHPLLLTQVTAAGLRALPTEWDLTLLIHQSELSAEAARVLSIGRKPLGFIPRGGRVLDFHCVVATYTELGSTCGSGAIPSLEIGVIPARQGLPILDDAMREKIANNFQPKLLAYRLANFSKVLNSTFDASELTTSMQELAQNLSACTPDDPDLQAQVPELLRTQDQETRSAAWLDINTVIIEAILASIHAGKQDCIYLGEIAKAAETILWGREEDRKLAAREIGTRLRLLELVTEPRNSKGIRLLLTTELSRRIHELAYKFSVPSIENSAKRCLHCRVGPTKRTGSRKIITPKE
jgi:hypothetical protein